MWWISVDNTATFPICSCALQPLHSRRSGRTADSNTPHTHKRLVPTKDTGRHTRANGLRDTKLSPDAQSGTTGPCRTNTKQTRLFGARTSTTVWLRDAFGSSVPPTALKGTKHGRNQEKSISTVTHYAGTEYSGTDHCCPGHSAKQEAGLQEINSQKVRVRVKAVPGARCVGVLIWT